MSPLLHSGWKAGGGALETGHTVGVTRLAGEMNSRLDHWSEDGEDFICMCSLCILSLK